MGRVVREDVFTLDEAIELLDDEHKPDTGDLASELETPSTTWDLNTPFSEARELARYGWEDKAEEIQEYFAEVERLLDNHYETRLDVTGEAVDIGAYLDGEPECMFSYTVPEVKSANFLIAINGLCDVDARTMMNRGIAIAALLYSLQSQGITTRLSIVTAVSSEPRGGGSEHHTEIEINQYGEYIDPGKLAFWLAHPAAFRRCIFRYREQCPDSIRQKFGYMQSEGYSSSKDLSDYQIEKRDCVYLPVITSAQHDRYETPEKAFKTVKKMLKEQGFDLFKE